MIVSLEIESCWLLNHYTGEALRMRRLKREPWKAGIAAAGVLLLVLLALMVWVPVSTAGASEGASGPATPGTGTVQATTTDPTIAAKTADEQLRKLQRDNERSFNAWVWNSSAAIISSLFSTLIIVVGALIGFRQWQGSQSAEREKRAQELFQSAVTGLGSEKEDAKTSGVANLRAFLRPGYEQYYTQIFDLAVANLRLPRTPNLPEDPDGIPHSPEDPNAPLSPTPLRQALINVFKEAFPLAREEWKKTNAQFDPRSLDATNVRLDYAFLWKADLKQVWMPEASLQKTDLSEVNLRKARLWNAKLHEAKLCRADLRHADLGGADLSNTDLSVAKLNSADLRGAHLEVADLSSANLSSADLSSAHLNKATLNSAVLRRANLRGADFSQAKLCGAKLKHAEYNKVEIPKGKRKNNVPVLPTKWPPDFIPEDAGAICVDDKELCDFPHKLERSVKHMVIGLRTWGPDIFHPHFPR
jgi:uncharacterized protein YjbI with pentapeptide repeats